MTRKVLIVDDSGVGRKLVRRCLEFAGLTGSEFIEAENGAKALEVLEAGGVDVLVTDLNMPVMDGVELLRAIAEIGTLGTLITIVMTSTVSEALKQDLAKYQVAGFVTKPVSPTTFAKVLAPLLG